MRTQIQAVTGQYTADHSLESIFKMATQKNTTDSTGQWPFKYRPRTLDAMILPPGVKARVEWIAQKRDASSILITGRTGSGKTTLARILAYQLARIPYGEPSQDVDELNVADKRSIDDVRKMVGCANFLPSKIGGRRVFILDEVHALTGQAASALLKPLEEPCESTVWILVTNQPEELLETIRNRCARIDIASPSPVAMRDHLLDILKQERALKGMPMTDQVKLIDACVAVADHVPRQAIQYLQDLVSSGGQLKDINGLVERMISSSPTAEMRKAASLVVLGVLAAGEGGDKIGSVMSTVAAVDSHSLLGHLQVVTTSLLLEHTTGRPQSGSYFFNEIAGGRLQTVEVENLALLLRHLVAAKAALIVQGADPRACLMSSLLSARSELRSLFFPLATSISAALRPLVRG